MPRRSSYYVPAWWVPGAHAQTLWGRLARKLPSLEVRTERWETPDDDFLDVHRIDAPADAPLGTPHVVLFHGLEGGLHSHYARGLLHEIRRHGWSGDLVIWRSCGDEPNRARRFYHSGETTDLDFALRHVLADHPSSPIFLAGVSLGGNVLLKYLGERGESVDSRVVAAAAISVPYDLARGAAYINRGFSKVYQRYFLDTLKRKAIEKQSRYPDLPKPDVVREFRTLQDFDDAVTAPIHGFSSALDYYQQSSSIGFLARIRIDTLLLNARDDPFLPSDVLDEVSMISRNNSHLVLDFPERGGHAGFVGGRNPFRPVYYLEKRVLEFFDTELSEKSSVAATRASPPSPDRIP